MNMLRQALNAAKPKKLLVIKGHLAGRLGQQLVTESEAMDMVEMQKFAVDLSRSGEAGTTNPNLQTLKREFSADDGAASMGTGGQEDYNTLYTIDAEKMEQEIIVDVGADLAGAADPKNFTLLVENEGAQLDNHLTQMVATLECMVTAFGGQVYHSMDSYMASRT